MHLGTSEKVWGKSWEVWVIHKMRTSGAWAKRNSSPCWALKEGAAEVLPARDFCRSTWGSSCQACQAEGRRLELSLIHI